MINNLVLFTVNVSIIDVWLPPKGLNEFSNQHMIFHVIFEVAIVHTQLLQ